MVRIDDVHHVREGVVVVAAHRGERDDRGPVLGHGIGEAVDRLQRARQVRLPFGLRPPPMTDSAARTALAYSRRIAAMSLATPSVRCDRPR